MKKSLRVNSLYNTFYRLVNVIYPLITATYTARVLQPAGVGAVAYAQNIAQYFILLAPMGIPNYGIRLIASDKKVDKTFSELFFLNFMSTTLCAIVYYFLVLFNTGIEDKLLYGITGITIVLNYLNVDWFYQGKEDYKYISIRNMCVKIISLLCVFGFVRSEGDYRKYALIYALGIAGNNLLNVLNLRRYNVKLSLLHLNIGKHIKSVVILLATTIAIEIYNLLDTTMLGYLSNTTTVAYYTNSIKLVKVLTTVIASLGGVILPRLSQYYSEGRVGECSVIVNKVLKVLTFLSIPAMVGVIGCSDLIIHVLYGEAFNASIMTLKIGAALVVVLGYSTVLGNQVLLAFGKEKELFLCTVGGALINIILNSMFIPLYEQNGAIFASVASEICVTVGTFIFANRIIKMSIPSRFLLGVGMQTILMGITLFVIRYFVRVNEFIQLMICVVCCGTVYFAVGYTVNNEFITEVLNLNLIKSKLLGRNKRKTLD